MLDPNFKAGLPKDPRTAWLTPGVLQRILGEQAAATWAIHPVGATNPPWLARDRGISGNMALPLLKLGKSHTTSWSPSTLHLSSSCLSGENSYSSLLEALQSEWASLGESWSLCRILSQFFMLSSLLLLSGTLELRTRSKVTLSGLFHWWTCSLGFPRLPATALWET